MAFRMPEQRRDQQRLLHHQTIDHGFLVGTVSIAFTDVDPQ
jgi:hypothetical protein